MFLPRSQSYFYSIVLVWNRRMENFWLKQLLKFLNLQNFTNSRSRVHLTCTHFSSFFLHQRACSFSNTTNRLTPRFPITSHQQTIKIIHRWARLRSDFHLFLVLHGQSFIFSREKLRIYWKISQHKNVQPKNILCKNIHGIFFDAGYFEHGIFFTRDFFVRIFFVSIFFVRIFF